MKRTATVLLLALCAGLGVHQAWYVGHAPPDPTEFESLLDEMRVTLHLDQGQFVRFRELHELFQPQLEQLAADVGQLRAEFAAFEKARRTTGEIDFLAYAGLVEKQRTVDRECVKSTQYLVLAALADMSGEQRSLYLSLLAPVLADTGSRQFR